MFNDMNNTSSHPAAEALAWRMQLPLTVDPVTRELYGHAVPVLDRSLASRQLARAGHLVGTPAHDAAMAILEARVERFSYPGR